LGGLCVQQIIVLGLGEPQAKKVSEPFGLNKPLSFFQFANKW
jgi:hypothetical protein